MPKYTILLIDYEPRSITTIQGPLEAAGYAVATATDGVAGMEAFAELKPDLTLVEAMIPKKHGFEVCKELKQSEHGRNAPVIIITSVYKGRRYRNQAKHQYNCDAYLEKPIEDRVLLQTVHEFLHEKTETPPAQLPAEPDAQPAEEKKPDAAESEISDHLDSLFS
ncbi:MAG: response regulator [bacterium]|nr:response regulator [bacterium]